MRALVLVALAAFSLAACTKKETPSVVEASAPDVFAEIAHITEVGGDARFVYVKTESDYFRIPKAGGKPEKLNPPLAADMPLLVDSGAPPAIPKLPEDARVRHVAFDANHLYLTTKPAEGTDNEGDVLRVTRADGKVDTWVDKQNRPWAIAIDANAVYWGTEDGLFKREKNSTMVKTLLRGVSVADTMVVDDRYVYWATRDRLMRVPKE